jgi:uncharacterized protein
VCVAVHELSRADASRIAVCAQLLDKPVASRRWGYYALPVLYGDALVGKLDATTDRQAGVLRVRAIHQDVPFTEAMTEAIGREVEDLARWLNLDLTPSSPRR